MQYLIGIIVALVGALFYTNSKRKTSDTLLEAYKSNTDNVIKDSEVTSDLKQVTEQANQRTEIINKLSSDEAKDVTQKDILDYFNTPHTD